MKKIYNACGRIICTSRYKDYRIIITPRHIEVKLTPKSNNDTEDVWIKGNDSVGKDEIYFTLRKLYFDLTGKDL